MRERIDNNEIPVLIVGAGPAGLTAAITLARNGIRSLLVERRAQLSPLPRATVISTWAMELLRSWGLESEVLEGSVEVEWRGWMSATLTSAHGQAIPLGLPTPDQSAALSPTGPACVPQDHLEPVLLRRLRTLFAGDVEFGTELAGLELRSDGGVRARLRDAAGEVRTVDARYVVAADGAHSAARAALGIAMRGPGEAEHAISALFRAPLWQLLGDRRYGLYMTGGPEMGVFVPAGTGDRWVYGVRSDSGPLELADFDRDVIARLIRLSAGVPNLEPRIERIGHFVFTAELADRFREGNVFLVGDAAHRVTPRGGTGMNMAIHDAYDLGWRLAWVLRGWASTGLLDCYEAERRPVAEHNLARSVDPVGSVRPVLDELHVDLGGRIPHLWLPDGRSTLDLAGPGLTLLTSPRAGTWDRSPDPVYGTAPVTVRTIPEITARALGISSGGPLLVGPDGVPARTVAARALAAA